MRSVPEDFRRDRDNERKLGTYPLFYGECLFVIQYPLQGREYTVECGVPFGAISGETAMRFNIVKWKELQDKPADIVSVTVTSFLRNQITYAGDKLTLGFRISPIKNGRATVRVTGFWRLTIKRVRGRPLVTDGISVSCMDSSGTTWMCDAVITATPCVEQSE